MRASKKLVLIAAGYALCFAGGLAAVAINELCMSAGIAQGSPGMVAFGDVILFILVAGFLSLAPTWFLLRLLVEKAPRALLMAELLMAAIGPLSWIGVICLALPNGPLRHSMPGAEVIGLLVAFVAIPRIVFGPPLVVIEAATFALVGARRARALLAAAMLMDLIPLVLFASHMAGAIRH
jgi:hypothetical protein